MLACALLIRPTWSLSTCAPLSPPPPCPAIRHQSARTQSSPSDTNAQHRHACWSTFCHSDASIARSHSVASISYQRDIAVLITTSASITGSRHHVCLTSSSISPCSDLPSGPLCNEIVAIPPGQDPNIRMEQHISTQCSVMTGKSGKAKSGPTCARGKCGKVLFAPIRCDVRPFITFD